MALSGARGLVGIAGTLFCEKVVLSMPEVTKYSFNLVPIHKVLTLLAGEDIPGVLPAKRESWQIAT